MIMAVTIHCEILAINKGVSDMDANNNANVPVSRKTRAIIVRQMYCEWDICIIIGIHIDTPLMCDFGGYGDEVFRCNTDH